MVRRAGQRRDFGRVVDDEGRIPELAFGHFLEECQLQGAHAGVGGGLHAVLGQLGTQPGGVIQLLGRQLGCMGTDGFHDGEACKRLGQVHRTALILQHGAAARGLCGVADHLLGVVHHPAAVGVGRVELHHRELGVVPRAQSLVAEVAVDLEHALEAADDQALQVQLGRDAQEHGLIQRVVVRLEGTGSGTAGNGLQHRRFHFQAAVVHHELADGGDGLAADDEGLARGLVAHQVHIALTVAHFLVGQAVELVGQWSQRFGEQPHHVAANGQLALLGLEERALGGHDVAQVPVLEGIMRFGAHAVIVHPELDAARGVLQRGKACLALHALQDHPACHGYRDVVGFQFLAGLAVVCGQQGTCPVGRHEIVGEGHGHCFTQRRQLGAPLGNDLVLVDGQLGVAAGCRSGFLRAGFGHDEKGIE